MKRFWIKFEQVQGKSLQMGLQLGCGVTANSQDEALSIIQKNIFEHDQIPKISEISENIDISTLDPKHVQPNMGSIFKKGIWFPLGY